MVQSFKRLERFWCSLGIALTTNKNIFSATNVQQQAIDLKQAMESKVSLFANWVTKTALKSTILRIL